MYQLIQSSKRNRLNVFDVRLGPYVNSLSINTKYFLWNRTPSSINTRVLTFQVPLPYIYIYIYIYVLLWFRVSLLDQIASYNVDDKASCNFTFWVKLWKDIQRIPLFHYRTINNGKWVFFSVSGSRRNQCVNSTRPIGHQGKYDYNDNFLRNSITSRCWSLHQHQLLLYQYSNDTINTLRLRSQRYVCLFVSSTDITSFTDIRLSFTDTFEVFRYLCCYLHSYLSVFICVSML